CSSDLKDLQPGSSIMPGKVNPVIPEAVTMVAGQVVGNDAAVAFGGAQGHFELNVFIPMMARNVLESARLLANASRVFADKCIDHIEANEERMKHFAESSTSIVTPLNSAIGYENAAKAAKHALHEKITVRQAVIDLGFVDGENLTEEELDKRLNVLSMTNRDRDNF
uniref:lyase family protein n=1 Tax=uncultured Corynebacterium sp. TaxID=159447 RepID=UPI0025ED1822